MTKILLMLLVECLGLSTLGDIRYVSNAMVKQRIRKIYIAMIAIVSWFTGGFVSNFSSTNLAREIC